MTRSRVMRARAAAAALLFAALLAAAGEPAAAQWTVEVGVRAPRFSGGALEPATGRSLSPYRPTVWEAGLGHRVGSRTGVGLRVHYASCSLALEGPDAVAAVKSALTVYGAAPELSVRLSRLGPHGVVSLFGGPLLEVWKLPDAGTRLRMGAGAAVGLEVPFGGRWTGSARIGAAVTPASPFTRDDLDQSLEPRALWRREVSATLGYRL